MIPGEVLLGDGPIVLHPGRPEALLRVENTGDRPVQVGSHFHLAAANPALLVDREAAWGTRLAIPAGTSVRFEPGVATDVTVVPLVGARMVPGLRADLAGPLDVPGTGSDG